MVFNKYLMTFFSVLLLSISSQHHMTSDASGFEDMLPSVTVCNKGCDYKTISDALNLAPGDIGYDILLLDHVYTENSIAIKSNVRIRSGLKEKVMIQGALPGEIAEERVFFIEETGDVVMENLVIRYGSAESHYRSGGGIHNRGKTSLFHCEISENRSNQGGGIWNSGTLFLTDCLITQNRTVSPTSMELAEAMGCRGAGGGIKNEKPGLIELTNCSIIKNQSVSRGGGVFVACESELKVINTSVTDNTSSRSGGGIHNRGTVTLDTCLVQNNYSRKKGMGITNLGILNVMNTTVTDNKGKNDCYQDKGAGFFGQGILRTNVNSNLGLGNCVK